jgi:arsenical pump membrane protein
MPGPPGNNATSGRRGRGAEVPRREGPLSTVVAESVSVVSLLAVLAFAVARPRRLPEAAAAVPAAGLVVAIGAVPPAQAWAQVRDLLPVVGFLAAVLVLAQLCDDEGLFTAAGDLMARTCRGRPERLLAGVFVVASLVTAVLSLDATVVLLTPVVFATTARAGTRPRPHVYACTHLANSASLLLPVSNLTNLLAFRASGLSFARFAGLMALPWLVAIAIEYAVFRRFFRADLAAAAGGAAPARRLQVPVFTLVVLGLTLAGFLLVSLAGLNPAWAALAGAVALSVRALARRRTGVRRVVGAAGVPFCLFVLALGVVVKAVVDNGLGDAVGRILPHGSGLPGLLALAAIAAALANLINNLPAVLALTPLVSSGGPGPVLATLIGVNLGPNLTYVGSLATLLWRRVLHERDEEPTLGDFTRLGLATVPATLVAATVALWAMLTVWGG